jgi:hypothetical protein
MKRTAAGAPDPKSRVWKCPDEWFAKDYPTLTAGLCDPWWDDGKPRDTWTLKIAYSGGGCTVVTNDPGGKLVLFTTAESLSAALEALELALQTGTAAWRKSKY